MRRNLLLAVLIVLAAILGVFTTYLLRPEPPQSADPNLWAHPFVATVRAAPADDKEGAWGTLKGKVVFAGGAIPAIPKLNVNKDEQHCLQNGPILSEELVVNKKNNGIRWAFVWLAPEKEGPALAVHPNLQKIEQQTVEMDQPCCMFIPHAVGLRQGQDLLAKNSAPVVHNVHWQGYPLKNPGGNQILPPKQNLKIDSLKADTRPVKISCDIHPWMNAWVRVFDHPYFAVTDEDGNYEIKLAPAGKFRLIMWHEKDGWGQGGKDGVPITIKAGGTTEAQNFTIK